VSNALERLAHDNFAEATVWSLAANDRANAFYESEGFGRDGTVRTQEAWADLLQVRYRRSLP